MLQSVGIDVEQIVGGGRGESGVDQTLVGFGGHHAAEIRVFLGGFLAGFGVEESGGVGVFVDLDEFLVILDVDAFFGDQIFDERISTV